MAKKSGKQKSSQKSRRNYGDSKNKTPASVAAARTVKTETKEVNKSLKISVPTKISETGEEKSKILVKEQTAGVFQKFFKENLLFIGEVIFALIIALVIISTGTYQEVEKQVSDLRIYFASAPDEQRQVVIVSIRNDDYEVLFGSQSPLNPKQLERVINAILKFQPAAVGVDIDTSDAAFQNLEINNNNIPIVWAQDAVRDTDGKITELKKVLGGNALPAGNYAAPVSFPVDSDNKIRHYQRIFKLGENGFPFFSWQLFNLYQPEKAAGLEETPDLRYINFAGEIEENRISYRLNLPATVVLEQAENNKSNGAFKHKIVILGGYYQQNKVEQAVDIHPTPVGEIFGADLLGSVTETEIEGGGTKPIGWAERIVFNFLTGIVMMFFFHRFSFLKALLWSGIIILIISLLIMLYYGNLFILPALLFILLLLIADTAKDRFKDILANWYEKIVKP